MTNRTNTTRLIKQSFIEMMKEVGTSVPGHVLAFDVDTQLVQIQVGVKEVLVNGETLTIDPIIEVPVYFAGGGYCVEYQIDPENEGIILFSQRCIDGWVNTGGVAENPIRRFNDYADAMFLPGMRSQPNKLQNFQNNGIRLRNPAGDRYIWLKNDGTAEMNVTSLSVTGDTDITGQLAVDGDVGASGEVSALVTAVPATAVNLSTHPHTSAAPGSRTSPPLPGQ